LGVSGGLGDQVHAAEPLLRTFWENRHNRFTEPERQALFTQLFGESFGVAQALSATLAVASSDPTSHSNTLFEALMVDVCEALFKFHPDLPPSAMYSVVYHPQQLDYTAEQRVRLAGRRLAENLSTRSSGLILFAAQELIEAIKQALALLKALSAQGALGSHNTWDLVRIVAGRYLNQSALEVGARTARAKTGEIVLAWLAEVYPQLVQDAPDPILDSAHPVVRAAHAWLEATLDLVQK
jgi:hypothetical protein